MPIGDEALCVPTPAPAAARRWRRLTAIEELLGDKVIRHALVIAPKAPVARNVWPDEIALWAHTKGLRYQVLKRTPTQRQLQLSAADASAFDITIVGIDIVQWLVEGSTRGCSKKAYVQTCW